MVMAARNQAVGTFVLQINISEVHTSITFYNDPITQIQIKTRGGVKNFLSFWREILLSFEIF